MTHPRKFRFGSQVMANSVVEWLEALARVEDWGYSTIGLGDHFFFPFAPLPALCAAAAKTTRLRFTTMLDNNVRYPVVLAKELATLDVISGGRLDVGIGAGSIPSEHVRFLGLRPTPIEERLERLEETLQIFDGLWSDEEFSFKGVHYSVDKLEGTPKPVQRPRPPIRMGGQRRAMLTLAGRKADIVNPMLPYRPAPAAIDAEPALVERLGWVREGAGDRFDDLELELMVWATAITDNPRAAAERLIPSPGGTNVEDLLANPQTLIGSVDSIVNLLQERRERYGVSYFNIGGGMDTLEAFAPVVARLSGT